MRSELAPPDGSYMAHLAVQLVPSTGTGVTVSPELWRVLLDELDGSAGTERILIAVQSRYPRAAQTSKSLPSLVVWAAQAQPIKASVGEQVLYAPQTLLSSHRHVFGARRPTPESPSTLLVSALRSPVPLSSVVLIAQDHESYHLATETSNFEGLLERECGVVREGETLDCLADKNDAGKQRRVRWSVAMAEPVLQGVIQKGFTRFVVLPPPDALQSIEDGESETEDSVGVDAVDLGDETVMLEEDDLEMAELEEEFDIDESFLAASVLSPPRISHPIPLPISDGLALTNGDLGSSTSALPLSPHQLTITAHPLVRPVASQLLMPRPGPSDDDIPRAYLRTRDLARLGMFSGDWVVATVGEESRLVQAFAGDGLIDETPVLDGSIQCFFPPTLLHNILPASASTASPPPISLLPAKGSSSGAAWSPEFPTAHSVTVARIASPHSVHRAYQSLFLDALKDYFQGRRRVLKQGDLLAVGISGFGGAGREERDDEEVDLPVSGASPTAVVLFQIASLELTSSAVHLASAPKGKTSDSGRTAAEFFSDQLSAGDFGCFVDPRVTKMVQTGLERSLVPDVAGFSGLPESGLVSMARSVLGDPTPASRLVEYVNASLRPGASDYDLHLTVLLKGARGCGKRTIVRSVARVTGFHLLEMDCFDLLGETEIKTEGHLRSRIDKAIACSPCILVLRNIEALARKSQALETGQEPVMSTILRECFATARSGWKASGFPIIIIGTTCDVDKIPTGVLGAFKEEISYEAPGEPERLAMLRSLTLTDVVAPDVSLRALAIQTAALVANDLVDLVRRARASATERILAATAPVSIQDLQHAGIALTSVDFNLALEKARSSYSESIGAPKIPNVTWDDVGGLANVKSDILDTIQLPLEHPELFADGLKKRSGILLYGPPGTGKTLLAKAVATSCSLNFFSIKGPELLNMYIGESEANVRRVFQRARDAKPCVIFFDELDSVAPKRGNQGDSGGVMDRIVSQLLAELDGMAEGKGGSDVFVIGATNRPDLLDPALLRPGRFDRMLYLGVSDNHDSQLKIIQALTRKFRLDPQLRLEEVANLCPFNYTGADFYALCSDAMLKAMTRKAEEVDTKIAEMNTRPPYSTGAPLTPQYYLAELATPAEIEVLVSQRDFELSLSELVPSVSKAEMLHYKTVQARYSGETMNSDEKMKQKQIEMPLPASTGKGKGREVRVNRAENGETEGSAPRLDKGKGKGRATE